MRKISWVAGIVGAVLFASAVAAQDNPAIGPPPAAQASNPPIVVPAPRRPAPPPIVTVAPPPIYIARPSLPVLPAPPGPPPKINGSFLYIYSFLDVREAEYTAKVLDQFDADLIQRFKDEAIDSKVLQFRQSKYAQSDEFFAGNVGSGTEARQVPVLETVASNLGDESSVHARYRLIVFPSNFSVVGAWRYYEIRFILMDTQTNRRLMSYLYSGRHLVLLKNSENASKRSKKIIDALFTQLHSGGFLWPTSGGDASP